MAIAGGPGAALGPVGDGRLNCHSQWKHKKYKHVVVS